MLWVFTHVNIFSCPSRCQEDEEKQRAVQHPSQPASLPLGEAPDRRSEEPSTH